MATKEIHKLEIDIDVKGAKKSEKDLKKVLDAQKNISKQRNKNAKQRQTNRMVPDGYSEQINLKKETRNRVNRNIEKNRRVLHAKRWRRDYNNSLARIGEDTLSKSKRGIVKDRVTGNIQKSESIRAAHKYADMKNGIKANINASNQTREARRNASVKNFLNKSMANEYKQEQSNIRKTVLRNLSRSEQIRESAEQSRNKRSSINNYKSHLRDSDKRLEQQRIGTTVRRNIIKSEQIRESAEQSRNKRASINKYKSQISNINNRQTQHRIGTTVRRNVSKSEQIRNEVKFIKDKNAAIMKATIESDKKRQDYKDAVAKKERTIEQNKIRNNLHRNHKRLNDIKSVTGPIKYRNEYLKAIKADKKLNNVSDSMKQTYRVKANIRASEMARANAHTGRRSQPTEKHIKRQASKDAINNAGKKNNHADKMSTAWRIKANVRQSQRIRAAAEAQRFESLLRITEKMQKQSDLTGATKIRQRVLANIKKNADVRNARSAAVNTPGAHTIRKRIEDEEKAERFRRERAEINRQFDNARFMKSYEREVAARRGDYGKQAQYESRRRKAHATLKYNKVNGIKKPKAPMSRTRAFIEIGQETLGALGKVGHMFGKVSRTALLARAALQMVLGPLMSIGRMMGGTIGFAGRKTFENLQMAAVSQTNMLKAQGFKTTLNQEGVNSFNKAASWNSSMSGDTTSQSQAGMASVLGQLKAGGSEVKPEDFMKIAQTIRGVSLSSGTSGDDATQKLVGLLTGRISMSEAGLYGAKKGNNAGETLDNIYKFLKTNPTLSGLLDKRTMASDLNAIQNAPQQGMDNMISKYPQFLEGFLSRVSDWVTDFFSGSGVTEAWASAMESVQTFGDLLVGKGYTGSNVSTGLANLLGGFISTMNSDIIQNLPAFKTALLDATDVLQIAFNGLQKMLIALGIIKVKPVAKVDNTGKHMATGGANKAYIDKIVAQYDADSPLLPSGQIGNGGPKVNPKSVNGGYQGITIHNTGTIYMNDSKTDMINGTHLN